MAIVALAGGVGGAKLADGLARVLPDGELTVIVNIGDDFRHLGLHISPDLDTVMYTLGDVANPDTGWGRENESWHMRDAMAKYGMKTWFNLGDRDLATHLLRTHWLAEGQNLTQITQQLSVALDISQTILPPSNDRFATMIDTETMGTLPFQEYFVKHRWQPKAARIWYDGRASAHLTDEVKSALEIAQAIIICPSNPILSIDPILAIGDMRQRILARQVPCIAVSPLLNGRAVKGPAAKILPELGYEASTEGILDFYGGVIDRLIVNHGDGSGNTHETDILMNSPAARTRLAREVLDLVGMPI